MAVRDMSRVPVHKAKAPRHAAMLAIVPLVAAMPALAAGPNTSPPAPSPATPAAVVTQTPPKGVGDTGGCVQQYTAAINTLANSALDKDDLGLAANAVGAAADVVGIIAEGVASTASGASFTTLAAALVADVPAVGTAAPGAIPVGVLAGTSFAEIAAYAAQGVGAASTVTGVAFQIASQVDKNLAQGLVDIQAGIPNCDQEFTGTVKVTAGGVNVTGVSIFNSDVRVDADVDVQGTVTASQVQATQGISAHSGNISLGDPNLLNFSDGITLGGGALSGAGNPANALAITGDVTAIAIGNGANAASVNSIAFGTSAGATGVGGTALGANAAASTGVAVGLGAVTTTGVSIGNAAGLAGDAGVAVGTNARARETSDTAIGNAATVSAVNGTALGAGATIASLSDNGVAIGQSTTIGGVNAVGSDNVTAVGRNIDIPDGVDNVVAVGAGAMANGQNATVVGQGASANFTHSAAFGQGAQATRAQQQVFGTTNNTYTMPGIASFASRSFQSGRLEVATSDAAGNLATDGGAIFRGLARVQAGVAVAMAMETPKLSARQNFGVRLGWGGAAFDVFDNTANAMGASVIGVLGRGLLRRGDRLAFDGGVGWGQSEFMDYEAYGVLGGRAGLQFAW